MTQRLRTIVFIGNCQAGVLASLYQRRVAALLNEEVVHVVMPLSAPERELPGVMATIARADIVVQQRLDSVDAIPEEAFAGGSQRRIRFPYLTGRFYWPYSGVTHVLAQPVPDRAPFPYVAEIGDSLLNQMILDQVPPDEALPRYDATVASQAGRIRRLAELHLERQRERDIACDMHFTDVILANYQREALFSTQGHPGMRLTRMLVEKVFQAIGVPYSLVDAAVRSLRTSPFPRQELPFHAGVAEVLGLTFVSPDQRYVFHHEGAFTFADYVRRYLTCSWEPELSRGLSLVQTAESETGVQLMQSALGRCEGSGIAWRTVGLALSRLGREEAALEAVQIAVQRDPGDPDTFAALAHLLGRQGRLAEAEAAARTAIEVFPFGSGGHRALAEVLGRQGRTAEAVAVARMALWAEPGDAKGLAALAHHLQRVGNLQEAADALRRARALEPANPAFERMHGDLEARLARRDGKAA